MKKDIIYIAMALLIGNRAVVAQSTVYTVLGGLSAGSQKWDNQSQRGILPRYHGALRIETLNEEKNHSSVFAQIGYHVRGSRQRFLFFTPGGGSIRNAFTYQFRNISLLLAAKSKKDVGTNNKFYYYGGIRGDYTLNTNLNDLTQVSNTFTLYFPSDGFVRHWLAGISVGAGLELNLKELVGAQIEFSVHPDFTLQYRQPALNNVIDPNNPGTPISISARNIRNITYELSVGIRLTRKVVYEE
jgi:hypothetical protein